MKKLFYLTNNHFNSKGFTYAPQIIPQSQLINHDCDVCGARGKYPSKEFDVILEEGNKYPDMLMCGAYPLLIVSEKVLNDWKKDDIKGFEYYTVGINKIINGKVKEINPPTYYHIIINGRCEIDLGKMGISIKQKCKKCGMTYFNQQPLQMKNIVLLKLDNTENDLYINQYFPMKVLCSEKVIINACKNKHTNFRFIELENALTIIPPPKGVDYLTYCK